MVGIIRNKIYIYFFPVLRALPRWYGPEIILLLLLYNININIIIIYIFIYIIPIIDINITNNIFI